MLWVNGTHAAVRQRFTLAHELGHLRCGHDARVAVDTFETLAGTDDGLARVQANAFAAELLAPAAGVRAMVDGEPTLDDVVLIAARFGISDDRGPLPVEHSGTHGPLRELKREIDDGLHDGRVAPALARAGRRRDRRDRRRRLPRLSPALGRLGASRR